MAIEVDTKDCTALSDSELADMADICAEGPAGFDDLVDIAVETARLGNASFDVRYTATVGGRPVCVGIITYVSVKPGAHDSVPIPDALRERLQEAHAAS